MKNYCFAMLLLVFSAYSLADVEGKISWIESETTASEQALQITMKGDVKTCTHANAKFSNSAYLDSSAPNFDSILSLALAAQMADKTILLGAYYDTAKGDRCIINKVRIINAP